MKIELKSKKDIPLLSRTRAKLHAAFEKETPSRDKVRKEVSNILKTKEELTIIKHIYPSFGKKEAKVIAHVYKNANEMKEIEEEHLLKKHVKEEAASETEEKPAEEKAEEKKEEATADAGKAEEKKEKAEEEKKE